MHCHTAFKCLMLISTFVPLLSGCATIASDKKYQVNVENPAGPTYFAIYGRKNRLVQQGITPEQVTLEAKSVPFWPASYKVAFVGENGAEHKELKAGFDPWLTGNIVFGGAGLAGLAVDGLTGAMFKLPGQVFGGIRPGALVSDVTRGGQILADQDTVRTNNIAADKSGEPYGPGQLKGGIMQASHRAATALETDSTSEKPKSE